MANTTSCESCQKIFKKVPSHILRTKHNFCSQKCYLVYVDKFKIKSNCKECNKSIISAKRENRKFCSQSCSAKYNNKNKVKGNKRSKLEKWIEIQLNKLYPNLEIHYNKKEAINSELDIYIPSLKLAFELNGIFHYEPIYGQDKLNQIQNNDQNKFQQCQKLGISLCIIDTSNQTYFKEITSIKYLEIINKVISQATACSVVPREG